MHPLPLPHALGTLQGSPEASRRGGDPLLIPGLRGIRGDGVPARASGSQLELLDPIHERGGCRTPPLSLRGPPAPHTWIRVLSTTQVPPIRALLIV